MSRKLDVRSALAGGLLGFSGAALGTVVVSWITPSAAAAGPFARMADAAAPLLAGMAAILALLAAAAGARRAGFALALAAAVAIGLHLYSHRRVTLPVAGTLEPELSVLFFNVGMDRPPGGEVVTAVLDAGADVLVLAEAGPLRPHLDRLADNYAFVSPCPADGCEVLVASRLPVLRFWRMSLNRAWPERYAVLEIARPGGGTMFVSAVHLAKPWMSGIAESEIARLSSQLDWLDGPAVVVGDFNMTVASRPMHRLLVDTGFRALRGQPGTWPASAALRLPIDHVLVRDGVRVTGVETFGHGLGPNHLGLHVRIAVETPPP